MEEEDLGVGRNSGQGHRATLVIADRHRVPQFPIRYFDMWLRFSLASLLQMCAFWYDWRENCFI